LLLSYAADKQTDTERVSKNYGTCTETLSANATVCTDFIGPASDSKRYDPLLFSVELLARLL